MPPSSNVHFHTLNSYVLTLGSPGGNFWVQCEVGAQLHSFLHGYSVVSAPLAKEAVLLTVWSQPLAHDVPVYFCILG